MNIIERMKLLYYLNKIWQQVKEIKTMKNWKTTMSALVVTVGMILKLFKIDLPEEVANSLITIGVFLMGLFAKDNNVTGGTIQQ